MTYTIVVQAQDGRWVFGPVEFEAELRREPRGEYASAADASQAAGKAPAEQKAVP